MGVAEAVEVVASGTGVAIVPMSLARLHQRKDTAYRPVRDLPPTTVGLAWRVDNEDPRVQSFIGIVRGRTERSSRGLTGARTRAVAHARTRELSLLSASRR